jgi:hypothetical protein
MASLHGSALQAEGDDILIAQQRTFIEAMVQQERPAERVDVANGSIVLKKAPMFRARLVT